MTHPSEPEFQEPAQLKFLRRLVTTLTAVMIGGLVVVITLLVIRLSDKPMPLPENITLPDGISAEAVTLGPGWIAIVSGNEILIFDAESGEQRQRIKIH